MSGCLVEMLPKTDGKDQTFNRHNCAKVTSAAIKRYFHLSVIILVMFSTLPVFAAVEMFMGVDSC